MGSVEGPANEAGAQPFLRMPPYVQEGSRVQYDMQTIRTGGRTYDNARYPDWTELRFLPHTCKNAILHAVAFELCACKTHNPKPCLPPPHTHTRFSPYEQSGCDTLPEHGNIGLTALVSGSCTAGLALVVFKINHSTVAQSMPVRLVWHTGPRIYQQTCG